mmetsp:Transcript_6697/g.19256  ORF Transcript_6697/g.19256 Transcript_6697/m.19256 type:complete len:363 (-) Transcript_6697:761-1849(-)|eukprot:CAMPEP_0206143278 /NCGR_PEP_ID=MMETSP1473-20131121/19967_1 /ASSEMBLY_ACC=CAM_ASM_001109 /TAXON_ID=1461547 /ORGANISM="Stichococcus sp, Strain RCC1054" /LENGTH=362 /DNA_ID=CAMNT_0053538613 /DNA_START=211 /DNA_END=1299 /DNA_ORIENTATION=-
MAHKSLTATFILHKTRKDRLESVLELNAWGQDVEDVSILSQTPDIKIVALACNCIKSLRQFSRCLKLEQLLLRKNRISDIAEVQHLSRLQHLRVLTLSENPIATEPSYRMKVLAMLPGLTKLDDITVMPNEVEDAQNIFPDAPHGISLDGSGSSQTPPAMSPPRSPAVTPLEAPPLTPSQRNSYAGGNTYGAPDPASMQPPGSHQQLEQPQLSPQQQVGYGGSYPAADPVYVNGSAPSPHQQYYPPPQQAQPQPQSYLSPNSGLTPGTYHPTQQQQQHQYTPPGGWQQPTLGIPSAAAIPPGSATADGSGGGSSSSDNIFYAIVALLPELGVKHLQWARDEVDARLLELQQQQLNLGGRSTS